MTGPAVFLAIWTVGIVGFVVITCARDIGLSAPRAVTAGAVVGVAASALIVCPVPG